MDFSKHTPMFVTVMPHTTEWRIGIWLDDASHLDGRVTANHDCPEQDIQTSTWAFLDSIWQLDHAKYTWQRETCGYSLTLSVE